MMSLPSNRKELPHHSHGIFAGPFLDGSKRVTGRGGQRAPATGNALTNANMAPFSDEHKSVQGLYGRFGGNCVPLYISKRFY